MTAIARKFLSKLFGIWSFLLLFTLKGAFLKVAYAQAVSPTALTPGVSSLDRCAAQPQCVAALGSELAPIIATPTSAGVSATVTATTATGVNSTTQAAAGVAVVGDMRLPGIVAYYLWQQLQNGQAQNLVKDRYCAVNPKDGVCSGQTYDVT